MRRRRLLLAGMAVLLAAFALPESAAACAVCTGGESDQVRYALLWGSGFLSVLPLALVGGLAWFVRKRAREIAAKHEARETERATRSAALP